MAYTEGIKTKLNGCFGQLIKISQSIADYLRHLSAKALSARQVNDVC
jgi:hypothetical protein